MIINTPKDYSSALGELVYTIEFESERDTVVRVIDEEQNCTIEVKSFYNMSKIKFDIAPIIRHRLLPKMRSSETGFVPYFELLTSIGIEIDGERVSSGRHYSLSERRIEVPSIVSSMPMLRVINNGEQELILIATELFSTLKAVIKLTPKDGSLPVEVESMVDFARGFKHLFSFDAGLYCEDYSSVELSFWVDDEVEIGRIYYTLRQLYGGCDGYRVAWLSEAGSVEHYTFPSVKSVVRKRGGKVATTISSAYGTAREAEALGRIIDSKLTYHVVGESYNPLEVLTTECSIREGGALQIVTLEVEENGQG